jgi:arylsulfatase A-like enzyme
MSHRPTRRSVIAGLSSVLGIGAASAVLGRTRKSVDRHRPNIVFFLGEGLRTDEFSIAGNPILKTPNMDRIGREGVIFRNAFVTNALCLPSRASILSGAYSHTTGATTNQEDQVPANFRMFTDVLRQDGYRTVFIGKSHVGGALMDRPWDYYFGFKGQADYLHPTIIEGRGGVYSEPKVYDRYVDDLLTDKAVEWIGTSGDEAFCLLLWFYAPHAPFYRPRRMLDLFNGVKIPVPEDFNDDLSDYVGKSRAVAEAENKIGTTQVGDDDPRSLEELVKDHYAGVESNDENVSRLLAALASRGKLDDTAIMLSSDHGFFLGEHTFYDKRLMYEPAIRVPMMIRWPNHVLAGLVRDEMVLNIDVAETLLEIAGLPIPPTMQGRSFLPLAVGKSVPDWRKDWLYEYYEYPGFENVRPHRGIRTQRYKLIHFFVEPQEFELYDLQTDPNEDKNLHSKSGYEALTAQLKARLEELRRETADHYQYRPSMTIRRELQLVPPGPQRPWRPNGS